MINRRGKILPTVLAAAEIIGAKPGFAATKEMPAVSSPSVEQQALQQDNFLRQGIEKAHQMIVAGKSEDAKNLAMSLCEQLKKVADLGLYTEDISELANRLREFGNSEQEAELYQFAYTHLDKEKNWKEKLQFGEEVARLHLLTEDKNAARQLYKEMYDLYQELIAKNRLAVTIHTRAIRDADGEFITIEPYQDQKTFQQYMDYQLGPQGK